MLVSSPVLSLFLTSSYCLWDFNMCPVLWEGRHWPGWGTGFDCLDRNLELSMVLNTSLQLPVFYPEFQDERRRLAHLLLLTLTASVANLKAQHIWAF